jgi:hypothetical protein
VSLFILQRISFPDTPHPAFAGIYGEQEFNPPRDGYELAGWKTDNRGDVLVLWKRKATPMGSRAIPYIKAGGLLDDVTQSYFADADDEDSW